MDSTSPEAKILLLVFWLGTTLVVGLLALLTRVGNLVTGALVAGVLTLLLYYLLPWGDVRSIKVGPPVLTIANGTSGQFEGNAQRPDTNFSMEGDPRWHLSTDNPSVAVPTTAIGQVKALQ